MKSVGQEGQPTSGGGNQGGEGGRENKRKTQPSQGFRKGRGKGINFLWSVREITEEEEGGKKVGGGRKKVPFRKGGPGGKDAINLASGRTKGREDTRKKSEKTPKDRKSKMGSVQKKRQHCKAGSENQKGWGGRSRGVWKKIVIVKSKGGGGERSF